MTLGNLAGAVGAECAVDGCRAPIVARGRCNRHYKQWKKSGGTTGSRRVHGEAGKTPEYTIWNLMVREPEGRCLRWASFEAFVSDMGRRPKGKRLLRKDTRQPFSFENCFWSSIKINVDTTRRCMSETKRARIFIDGKTLFKCGGECGKFLPVSLFYRLPGNINGIRSRCKKCHQDLAIRTRDPYSTRQSKRRSEARRRARKLGTVPAMTLAQEVSLEGLWGSVCLRCGETENLTWDHIVPLSLGGPHCVTNLQCLCRSCNERKHTRIADFRSAEQIAWANLTKVSL